MLYWYSTDITAQKNGIRSSADMKYDSWKRKESAWKEGIYAQRPPRIVQREPGCLIIEAGNV